MGGMKGFPLAGLGFVFCRSPPVRSHHDSATFASFSSPQHNLEVRGVERIDVAG